jgi:uncharacterized membrane protein
MLKHFGLALGLFLVLDFLWLGVLMKNFNARQLAEIGRFKDGSFDVLYAPAVGAYLLMALAVAVFVMPRVSESTYGQTFLLGALLGLIVYGIFDFTNLAILRGYPLTFALVDMAWGTFVFGAVTVLVKAIGARI